MEFFHNFSAKTKAVNVKNIAFFNHWKTIMSSLIVSTAKCSKIVGNPWPRVQEFVKIEANAYVLELINVF